MKENGYRVGVGASSILTIFVVLCLTTLGVLSFASARANATLTSRREAYVEHYYAAVAEAQHVMMEIDRALVNARKTPDTYAELVQGIKMPDIFLEVSEDLLVSFSVPCGEMLELQVAVQAADSGDWPRYRVVMHQLVNIADWEPDTSYELPGKDEMEWI